MLSPVSCHVVLLAFHFDHILLALSSNIAFMFSISSITNPDCTERHTSFLFCHPFALYIVLSLIHVPGILSSNEAKFDFTTHALICFVCLI